VLAPLWIPACIVLAILLCVGTFFLVGFIIPKRRKSLYDDRRGSLRSWD
jgi:hypothetical protein